MLGRTPDEVVKAYKSGGRIALLRALLPASADDCTAMPTLVAYLQGEVGNKDQAFSCLERAYELRDSWLLFLKVSPSWDRLRGDARFDSLIRRVGLT